MSRVDENVLSQYGGYLAEIPKPWNRLFPNGTRRKRIVRVSFNTYYGIGHHTWATVQEEDNPIRHDDAWVLAWDDSDGKGRHFSNRFGSRQAAKRWAQRIIDKHFPVATHRPIDERAEIYQRRPRRWHYRDGD